MHTTILPNLLRLGPTAFPFKVVKIFDHLFLLVLAQFIDNSGQRLRGGLARKLYQ